MRGILINSGRADAGEFVDGRTPLEKEVADWEFRLIKARKDGHWKAANDIRKHLDALKRELRHRKGR